MKKFLLFLAFAFVVCASNSACTSGQPYNGPEISTVNVNGTYTDKDGETVGGGIGVGLAYPTPSPTPKAVDHSK